MPVISAPDMVIVPLACEDVCARIAARPPIALTYRSMIERADGRSARSATLSFAVGDGFAPAGPCFGGEGACFGAGAGLVVCAASVATDISSTRKTGAIRHRHAARPQGAVTLLMRENSTGRGASAILTRDKRKGKRSEKSGFRSMVLFRNARDHTDHVMQIDDVPGFDVLGRGLAADAGESGLALRIIRIDKVDVERELTVNAHRLHSCDLHRPRTLQ